MSKFKRQMTIRNVHSSRTAYDRHLVCRPNGAGTGTVWLALKTNGHEHDMVLDRDDASRLAKYLIDFLTQGLPK